MFNWIFLFSWIGVRVVQCVSPTLIWLTRLEKNGYNKDLPPNFAISGTTTSVRVGFYVESMGDFRGQSMDYDIDIYFRQQWTDRRLRHKNSSCIQFNDRNCLSKMWQPDVYFANSKRASYNHVTTPNMVVKICPNGTIKYSVRISIKLFCNMDLRSYPLDRQMCHIKILPYGNNQSRVLLHWDTDKPIAINGEIVEIAGLQLNKNVKTDYCNGVYPDGVYSCLITRFRLRRRIGYSLFTIYLPSLCVVMISWISFWLDPQSVPGRVGLAVTTLLTLATQSIGVAYQLPPVGYAKAVDVWLGICLMFLFGALIEFTIVNMLIRKWLSANNTNTISSLKSFRNISEEDMEVKKTKLDKCYRRRALLIDRISRIAFPSFFALFMIIYWPVYLSGR